MALVLAEGEVRYFLRGAVIAADGPSSGSLWLASSAYSPFPNPTRSSWPSPIIESFSGPALEPSTEREPRLCDGSAP